MVQQRTFLTFATAGCMGLLLLFMGVSAIAESEVRVRVLRSDKPLSVVGQLSRIVQLKPDPIELFEGQSQQNFFYDQSKYQGYSVYVEGTGLKVDGVAVPEKVLLNYHASAKYQAIAILMMNEYLMGVLPSEMPVGWGIEALKAQAIASRTYVRNVIQHRRYRSFDVEATVMDQVYRPLESHALSKATEQKVRSALSETRGQFLTDQKGDLITAYYHADSAGSTESPAEVWGEGQSFGLIKGIQNKQSPYKSWVFKRSREELESQLRQHFGLKETARLRALRVSETSSSGRAHMVEAQFWGVGSRKISGQDLRKLLGFGRLKSTLFKMSFGEKQVVFRGKGFGHGVGLCQWGAKYLAEQGFTYRDILKHYYPTAELLESEAVQRPLASTEI